MDRVHDLAKQAVQVPGARGVPLSDRQLLNLKRRP